MYRFVTCDDPTGVVECGAIRKSKACPPKMDHKSESHRTQKSCKKEKKDDQTGSGRSVEEFHSPSSFQLLEICKGAQKLNQMIDSWTNSLKYSNGQSKHIAKDLLRGALDLQESLVMLNKLQEASHYMSHLKYQEKKSPKAKTDPVDIQRRRNSVDGSSRESIEELKTAVRDGLARHNLLPEHERTDFDWRLLDWASDMPSTSSSQSSVVRSSSSHFSTESSFSEKPPDIKGKGSNLIAKLMGLEDMPEKSVVRKTLKQQFDIERSLRSPQRPGFEFEMPKLWKTHPKTHDKVDSEQKTLKEILETMQFKGLLKSNPLNDLREFHQRRRSVDGASPIVLMKPLLDPEQETGEVLGPIIWENQALNAKMKPKKVKVKEGTTVANKQNTTASEMRLVERLAQEGEAKDLVQLDAESDEKEMKADESPSLKDKVLTIADREVKSKLQGSSKPKVSRPVRRTSEKEVRGEFVKPKAKKAVSKFQDHDKLIPSTPRKSVNGSVDAKNQNRKHLSSATSNGGGTKSPIPRRSTSAQKVVSKQATKAATNSSTSPNKKGKVLKRPPAANTTVNNNKYGEEEGNNPFNNNPVETELIVIVEELPRDIQPSFSNLLTEDQCKETNFVTLNINHKPDSLSHKVKSQLKALLLSSPSFVNHAEELFHLKQNDTMMSISATGTHGSVSVEGKLSMDYANEFIKRQSCLDSRTRHSLLPSYVKGLEIRVSLDQLVEEVCDGVEILRSYTKVVSDNGMTAYLYAILERDLSCKEVVSDVWDFGWRCGFSVEEAEQAVKDVEKLIEYELIEEVFA